jgi:type IV pilus assembly protein PilC
MKIPVVKNIIIYKEIIMFTKTFASLINYDVFITDSMEILGKITNNEIYRGLIKQAVINLSNGNGVSEAFKDHWAFPPIAYEMLLTGERTGRLGVMMDKVSNYYNSEQKNLVAQLKSLIEPVMIIFLAVVVGVVLLAVIVPMFSMYEQIA